jgi:hypothetical protein
LLAVQEKCKDLEVEAAALRVGLAAQEGKVTEHASKLKRHTSRAEQAEQALHDAQQAAAIRDRELQTCA